MESEVGVKEKVNAEVVEEGVPTACWCTSSAKAHMFELLVCGKTWFKLILRISVWNENSLIDCIDQKLIYLSIQGFLCIDPVIHSRLVFISLEPFVRNTQNRFC